MLCNGTITTDQSSPPTEVTEHLTELQYLLRRKQERSPIGDYREAVGEEDGAAGVRESHEELLLGGLQIGG